MEVWASIDLMDGKVVRLVRGSESNIITYSNDPIRVVSKLASAGFDGIHVVDLDAALGRGNNLKIVKDIVKSVEIHTQVGGGIRSKELVSDLLENEVGRVVLGTLVFVDHDLVVELLKEFGPERFVAALDYANGRVVYKGWKSSSGMTLLEGYETVRELGMRYVLATSVEKDGTLSGPDVQSLSSLPLECREMTYASGGISSPSQVAELASLGLRGVILGRALYEGLFPFSEFIRAGRDTGDP